MLLPDEEMKFIFTKLNVLTESLKQESNWQSLRRLCVIKTLVVFFILVQVTKLLKFVDFNFKKNQTIFD
jgi:hypothetical protein